MTSPLVPELMAELHKAAYAPSRGWSAQEFATLLSQPTCLAVGDRRGFALVRMIADEAELLTIATHPDHRRQGVARACMDAWLGHAVSRGATRAFLDVAADNTAAIGLYAACGFERCGLRRGYYRRADGDPVDALLMARTLSRS